MSIQTYRRFLTEGQRAAPQQDLVDGFDVLTEEQALALITEDFPPILLTVPPKDRGYLARFRGANNASTQTEIPKDKANKKPYSNEGTLLVYVKDGQVFAYGDGTFISVVHPNFEKIQGWQQYRNRRMGGVSLTRKDAIELADQVFHIATDDTNSELRRDRANTKPNEKTDNAAVFVARAKALLSGYVDRLHAKLDSLRLEAVGLCSDVMGSMPERCKNKEFSDYSKFEDAFKGPSSDKLKIAVARMMKISAALRDIENERFSQYEWNGSDKFDPKVAASKMAAISDRLKSLVA